MGEATQLESSEQGVVTLGVPCPLGVWHMLLRPDETLLRSDGCDMGPGDVGGRGNPSSTVV